MDTFYHLSYSFAAEQVAMLEERIRLRDDNTSQLVSKVTDLEAQLASLRTELASKTDEAAHYKQELDERIEAENLVYILALRLNGARMALSTTMRPFVQIVIAIFPSPKMVYPALVAVILPKSNPVTPIRA